MKYNLEEVLKGNYIKKTLRVNSSEELDQLGEFYGQGSLLHFINKFPVRWYGGTSRVSNHWGSKHLLVGGGWDNEDKISPNDISVKEFFNLNGFTPKTEEITKKSFFFEQQGTYTVPETVLSYSNRGEMEELEGLLQELNKFIL